MNTKSKRQLGLMLRHSEWLIIGIYNFVIVLVCTGFYFLIPILMSYTPDFKEVSEIIGFSYNGQFIIVLCLATLFGSSFFLVAFRDFRNWDKCLDESEERKKINRIRKKCINLPYTIFIVQITFFLLPTFVMITIIKEQLSVSSLLYGKLIAVIFSILTLVATLSHAIIKPVFTKILSQTYQNQGLEGNRIGLQPKIFMQMIPMFVVTIIIVSLMGYNSLLVQKGDMIYENVDREISEALFERGQLVDSKEAIEVLMDIGIESVQLVPFLILPNGELMNPKNEKFSDYYRYYMKHPIKGHVYGDTIEDQGVIKEVIIDGEIYWAGLKFQVYSQANILITGVSVLSIMMMSFLVLYLFSKSLSDDIREVSKGLIEISSSEVNLNKKLPLTSNDELGDLVLAFNKIQEKIRINIERAKKDQEIIIEQERLAYLGQLVGGIAENFKLPLASINEGLTGLSYLVNAYKGSIVKGNLEKNDHEQLADAMFDWLEKMKPYNGYMTGIMGAIKEQLVSPYRSTFQFFSLADCVNRVDLLMDHQLCTYPCKLIKKIEADLNTNIHGEISHLIQILNNLLLNAAQAYGELGGNIEFGLQKEGESVIFSVKDTAGGIPFGVKEKLFKNILTTKGDEGTGLGLYISYAKIKGVFMGEMWLDSELGKGTTVFIKLPAINEFLVM